MTDYHWTPALELSFVEALADTGSVTEACRIVSMSRRAAYDRKRKGAGLAFRIGWDAAVLLARDVVADELLDRALAGQWTETIKDPETGKTRRFAQDRNLGLALLSRLDRMCDIQASEGTMLMAAQIVSQDFEAFLDLMVEDGEKSASVTDVRTFLSLREDAWRLGDQLPREDAVQIKGEVTVIQDTAFQCEVAQNLASPRASTRGPAHVLENSEEAGPRLGGRGDEGDETQCEVAQTSGVSEPEATPEVATGALNGERKQPHHRPFHPIATHSTPQPGHPDYHRWIKNQSWARM